MRLVVTAAVNDFTDTSVSKQLSATIFRVCALHEFVLLLKNSTSRHVHVYLSIHLCIFMYLAIRSLVCRVPAHSSIQICRSLLYHVSLSVDISIFIYVAICPSVLYLI